MKKFSVIFFALVLALFCISCGSTTSKDKDCDGDDEDCGDTAADTTPSGDTDTDTSDSDNPDNPDSDTPDTVNPDEPDTENPDEPDTDPEPAANGIITQIQKGEIAEKTEVTVPECVVTAILYAQNSETHENTAIKGVYVSEIIKKAQPYSGIYVFQGRGGRGILLGQQSHQDHRRSRCGASGR